MMKNKLSLKVKKLHEDALIPKYASPDASGFDLHALESIYIYPQESKLVRTGLAFEIPEGFELQIRPRSGLSLRTFMRLANSPGTIDADYRGEVQIIVWNADSKTDALKIEIKAGDKIAQGVVCPVIRVQFEESSELTKTDRNDGGFGSTGI